MDGNLASLDFLMEPPTNVPPSRTATPLRALDVFGGSCSFKRIPIFRQYIGLKQVRIVVAK
jgi:hypothetical protein